MKSSLQLRAAFNATYVLASFAMTITRLFVALYAGLLIYLQANYSKATIIWSILFIMVFDYYDGKLFNKSGLRSVRSLRIKRRLADSIADRMVIQMICIPLVITDESFLWVYLCILARELYISAYTAKKLQNGLLLYPGTVAKLACVMVGIVTIFFLTMPTIILVLVVALMVAISVCAIREYKNKVINYTPKLYATSKTLIEIL